MLYDGGHFVEMTFPKLTFRLTTNGFTKAGRCNVFIFKVLSAKKNCKSVSLLVSLIASKIYFSVNFKKKNVEKVTF